MLRKTQPAQVQNIPDHIGPEFFSYNRRRLLQVMAPDSVALLGGNYPLHTNGDGVLPYIPNSDLWYFTGMDRDTTLLFLVKPGHGPWQEILFIPPRDPAVEVWEGKHLSPEEAATLSGIKEVRSTPEWEATLKGICFRVTTLYLNLQEHPRAPYYRNRNHDLHDHCRKRYPLHHYQRLAPLIHPLRMVKLPVEAAQIRKAAQVSRDALERVLPLLREGVSEKEIEAEMTAVYIKQGGGPAFSPIIASGKNSCTLHYISNREILRGGEVILIDSGAQIPGRYSADVTRVFPVGKSGLKEFTPRQRQVYEAVLRILERTIALVKPGVTLNSYKEKSLGFVKEELRGLGLLGKEELSQPKAMGKYFMHGISHWLGLDVHDVGGYEGEFTSGMVLTCEPGIYIPEEEIGVRLEENLWISPSGKTENLTASIPIEVEDVYRWLGDSGYTG